MASTANTGQRVIDGSRGRGSYEKLTVSSTAIAPASPPANATAVLISVEGGAIRWRDDGTAPTASIGNPLPDGAIWLYTGDPTNLLFIRQTVDVTVNLNHFL